jgi:hypothetical protein
MLAADLPARVRLRRLPHRFELSAPLARHPRPALIQINVGHGCGFMNKTQRLWVYE